MGYRTLEAGELSARLQALERESRLLTEAALTLIKSIKGWKALVCLRRLGGGLTRCSGTELPGR